MMGVGDAGSIIISKIMKQVLLLPAESTAHLGVGDAESSIISK